MTYRVLTAEPAHETNTFSCRPTNAQAFKDQYLLIGQQAIAARGQAGTELAGFLDAAKGPWVGAGSRSQRGGGVGAAADVAKNFDPKDGPLVIADYADNPGAGGYGDGANLLAALLEAGTKNAFFGPMVDGEAAAVLHQAKVGDQVSLALAARPTPPLAAAR